MPILAESPKHRTTYITISRDEYESMKSTIEVLKDPDLMDQLRKSRKAVKEGKVKKWDKFMKEMGIT